MFFWIVVGLIALFMVIRHIKLNHDGKVQWEMQERKKAQEKKEQAHTRNMTQAARIQTHPKGIDSRSLPSYMSVEEREEIAKVATHTGNRFVTQNDIHKYILDNMAADFAKMSGWDMWDESIHHFQGQFERAERGSHLSKLQNITYDSRFQIARVVGSSGVYLTTHAHCSCPDFRQRHLPCKHMYALAMALDGDPEKDISSSGNHNFLGLTFALAGRFPKGSDGKTVKDKIQELGGNISDNVTFHCSALVLGNNPSENKIKQAKEYDMEIMTLDVIERLLQ